MKRLFQMLVESSLRCHKCRRLDENKQKLKWAFFFIWLKLNKIYWQVIQQFKIFISSLTHSHSIAYCLIHSVVAWQQYYARKYFSSFRSHSRRASENLRKKYLITKLWYEPVYGSNNTNKAWKYLNFSIAKQNCS